MKEIYSWVPWFRELGRKIEEGGEAYLIEKARQVEWTGDISLLEYGDEGIDPFSFFYFLASKNTRNRRRPVYDSVSHVFGIESLLPDMGIDDYYIFPTPDPRYNNFYNRENFESDSLWRLFKQAVKNDPEIDPDDFEEALEINGVRVARLTQTLFLINPEYFLTADKTTFHLSEALGLPTWLNIEREIEDGGYERYKSLLKEIKKVFPECQPYEINLFLWMIKSEQVKLSNNFFQISTNARNDGIDCWDSSEDENSNFKENNYVYTGGPGPTAQPYPLTEPKRGDIILVRTGMSKARAIGIVKKNDYSGGWTEEGVISVLWINKSERSSFELFGRGLIPGFTKTHPEHPWSRVYSAFRTEYRSSFDLIKNLAGNATENGPEPDSDQQPEGDTMKYPLNQILYGPPGTGKTWITVNYSLAIIEGKPLEQIENEGREEVKRRFDELKKNNRIAMVTFHQNFAYEDFIEGIRPVLRRSESREDIQYELSKGVFREIACKAYKDRSQKYVLIIDEINRGNIAKIFGELITLIEPSKRIGGDDATTVKLPYSEKEFGVSDNLYIIGTMNTADRSIAQLDTALRRRFEFVEMMPDSKHSTISNIAGVNCQELLAVMNERIHFLLDREHQIGHTYFMDIGDLKSLEAAFKNKIIPLLQEYFYDHWEKIDLVLNHNGFICKIPFDSGLFKNTDLIDEQRKIYGLLSYDDGKWKVPESYKAIYERGQSGTDETE